MSTSSEAVWLGFGRDVRDADAAAPLPPGTLMTSSLPAALRGPQERPRATWRLDCDSRGGVAPGSPSHITTTPTVRAGIGSRIEGACERVVRARAIAAPGQRDPDAGWRGRGRDDPG